MDPYDCSFITLITGDSKVGKSLLLQHELSNFYIKINNNKNELSNLLNIEDKLYTLNGLNILSTFIDIPGPDRYIKLLNRYSASSAVIIYIYDVTNISSLEHIEERISEIKNNGRSYITQILIGNKIDLPNNERQVSIDYGERWAKEHGLKYFETSAITGEGVTDAFAYIITSILNFLEASQFEPSCLLEKNIKISRKALESSDVVYI